MTVNISATSLHAAMAALHAIKATTQRKVELSGGHSDKDAARIEIVDSAYAEIAKAIGISEDEEAYNL